LSQLYELRGENKKAMKFAQTGLIYAEKLNAKDLLIEAMWNQARVRTKTEKSEEIENLFLEAIEMAKSLGHNTFLWKMYMDLAEYMITDDKIDIGQGPLATIFR